MPTVIIVWHPLTWLSLLVDVKLFGLQPGLHHLSNLNERDVASYRTAYDLIVSGLPKPDLLIYLWAPVPVLMDRIHQRGRDMESGISADYLTLLESFYEEWLKVFDLCPVLTIRSSDLDFVHNTQDLGDLFVEGGLAKESGR